MACDPAAGAWRVFRMLLAALVLALLALLVIGVQMVRIVPPDASSVIQVQTTLSYQRLAQTMLDMSFWSQHDGIPRDLFIERMDSLLDSHRASDQDAILDLKQKLIQEYPK